MSILTASDDGTAKLWRLEKQKDPTTGAESEVYIAKVEQTFSGHTDFVKSAVFTRAGEHVITASDDGTARVWDLSAKELVKLDHQGAPIRSVDSVFEKDGSLLVATGSSNSKGRIWKVNLADEKPTGQPLLKLDGHTATISSVAFSKYGTRLLTASEDKSVKLWDTKVPEQAAQEPPAEAEVPPKQEIDVLFRQAQPADALPKKDVPQAKEILTLSGHTREVTSVAFSPDGKSVLTASQDQTAILWLAMDWPGRRK